MTSAFEKLSAELLQSRRHWVVTGAAGFIGSHLTHKLLSLGQSVTGLDDLSTGSESNLEAVKNAVGAQAWGRFNFIKGDIRNLSSCHEASKGAQYVLHQAALASVPRSITDPISSTQVNIDGFVNIAVAARDAGVKRIVYASSSAVYGDAPGLPKVENVIGEALSPYGLSKYVDELYAGVFAKVYDLQFIGLRYFNIFGPRQSLDGPYAAVLPCWVRALKAGQPCEIYGDGETSRDFCFIDNAVQANILAACAPDPQAVGKAYNIAVGEQTTLNQLYSELARELGAALGRSFPATPLYKDFRQGDIRHSLASIESAKRFLGYQPSVRIGEGLKQYVAWLASQ
jgi:UDP-N-acetylglucosamine 4-epimerase